MAWIVYCYLIDLDWLASLVGTNVAKMEGPDYSEYLPTQFLMESADVFLAFEDPTEDQLHHYICF